MSDLQLFQFQDQGVRTQVINGEPVFAAADVAAVVGISKYRDAVTQLDDDERVSMSVDTLGGRQSISGITESGVWSFMLISRSPRVKPFRRWITGEVLPQIRKTGSYSTANAHPELVSRADLARMVLEAEEEKQVIAAALESAAPAIAYHDRFVANDDAVTVKDWAAEFGITEPTARQKLVDAKIIYRKLIGERWSASEHKKVKEFEYRAYASYLPLFDLRPQHNAPRHHNGQVRQTLYIRQEHALQLGSRVGLFELTRSLPLEGEAA